MRTLMTLLTLGAAGAGYVYLNQTPAAGEPYSSTRRAPALFDWSRDVATHLEASRVPVKELVHRIHEKTKTVLDEFADQLGGHSDAPIDDAFQRLRQVAQSSNAGASRSDVAPIRDASDRPRLNAVPLPDLDELQRTAFDPAAEPNSSEPNVQIQTANGDNSTKIEPLTAHAPETRAIDSSLEPTSKEQRSSAIPMKNSAAGETSISNVSQQTTTATAPQGKANTPPIRGAKSLPVEWKVVGKTTEGRPMHSVHFGDSGTRTLVIAGLNGEDRVAVRWLELLVQELAQQPDRLKSNEIVFFRAGNPDGLVHNTRNNVRGVPLNRNFPSRRYRPAFDLPKFAVPAGEVETRVMLDTLYTFRPRRVIHLTSTAARSQAFYNRSAKATAAELERSLKLSLSPLDAEQNPGSLEDFADGTLEAAVLTVRLSVGSDWQQAWTQFSPHLLSAVVGKSIESPDAGSDKRSDPDRSPIPNANVEPVSRRPTRRGYEELSAPPDSLK